MKYELFGKSGLRVSELCLGTMTFGEDWGSGASKAVSKQIFDAYTAEGGNFIDTANTYTNGSSEKFAGEFIAGDRDRYVLATKYAMSKREGDPNFSGNHRKNMFQAVKASLERLDTDYIDLYWLHHWDYFTPVEEVVRGLNDLIQQGLIHYIGVSNTPAWIISRMITFAEAQGMHPFIGLQLEYSLVERTIEREYLPMAQALQLGVTAWSPLGGGLLTGKYHNPPTSDAPRRLKPDHAYLTPRNQKIVEAVQEVAKEHDASAAQVALSWVHRRGIPVIGARSVKHIQDNLGSLSIQLTEDQVDRLEQVSTIDLGFPYTFLQGDFIRGIRYGKTYDLIRNRPDLSP